MTIVLRPGRWLLLRSGHTIARKDPHVGNARLEQPSPPGRVSPAEEQKLWVANGNAVDVRREGRSSREGPLNPELQGRHSLDWLGADARAPRRREMELIVEEVGLEVWGRCRGGFEGGRRGGRSGPLSGQGRLGCVGVCEVASGMGTWVMSWRRVVKLRFTGMLTVVVRLDSSGGVVAVRSR